MKDPILRPYHKGVTNLPVDAQKGAGGVCAKHGVYQGLRCPYCAPAGVACEACVEHLTANWEAMMHAAASVGIEQGLTTEQAIRAYYRDFHRTGHAPRASNSQESGE